MITPYKLPFRLSFGRREGDVRWAFTRFTTRADDLAGGLEAGLTVTENQDLYVRFEAPPGYRFTMDGLDVVTLPSAVMEDGTEYLPPQRRDLLLFKGESFPLVPGYYALSVTRNDHKTWYGMVEITPKFMGREGWEDMRSELMDEIKNLSFDFMKRTIHISKSMEGALSVSEDALLRFYTIRREAPVVMNVLSELAATANSRPVMRMKTLRWSGIRKPAPHLRPQHVKVRQGASSFPVVDMEMTWDIPENRFAKGILTKLDRNLCRFTRDVDGYVDTLKEKQQELTPYRWDRDLSMVNRTLAQFAVYRDSAAKIREAIRRVSRAPWFADTGDRMPSFIPAAAMSDPRYSVLWRLHQNLEHPRGSMDISSFYQFQWKRTDKLYELWGFLQFLKALSAKGWELESGVSVIYEEGKYRLSSLESGTRVTLKRGSGEIHLIYDGEIPATSADTDKDTQPLYTNQPQRRPDLRLDYYEGGLYAGSLIADFKYRDILYLWQDQDKSEGLRRQFNAYRDMNTKYYRGMDELDSLRNSRPVKEVWAVFPREMPPQADTDYSLRFIPLSPGLEGNKKLPDMLDQYIRSLST